MKFAWALPLTQDKGIVLTHVMVKGKTGVAYEWLKFKGLHQGQPCWIACEPVSSNFQEDRQLLSPCLPPRNINSFKPVIFKRIFCRFSFPSKMNKFPKNPPAVCWKGLPSIASMSSGPDLHLSDEQRAVRTCRRVLDAVGMDVECNKIAGRIHHVVSGVMNMDFPFLAKCFPLLEKNSDLGACFFLVITLAGIEGD